MDDRELKLKEARYRVKAKQFRKSIPIGMCSKLPDNLIDTTPDEDIKILKKCLYAVGLVQIKTHLYGYWEPTYSPDTTHHFKLEEIL